MRTTLEDLYYGNISPHERYIKRGTRVDNVYDIIDDELRERASLVSCGLADTED